MLTDRLSTNYCKIFIKVTDERSVTDYLWKSEKVAFRIVYFRRNGKFVGKKLVTNLKLIEIPTKIFVNYWLFFCSVLPAFFSLFFFSPLSIPLSLHLLVSFQANIIDNCYFFLSIIIYLLIIFNTLLLFFLF